MSQELKNPVAPLAELLHHMGIELGPFTADDVCVKQGELPESQVMIITVEGVEHKFHSSKGSLALLFAQLDLPEELPEGVVGFYRKDGVYHITCDSEMSYEEALDLTGYRFDMKYVHITEGVTGTCAELNIIYPFFEGKIMVTNAKEEEVVEETTSDASEAKPEGQEEKDPAQQESQSEGPAVEVKQPQHQNKHKNQHKNHR